MNKIRKRGKRDFQVTTVPDIVKSKWLHGGHGSYYGVCVFRELCTKILTCLLLKS